MSTNNSSVIFKSSAKDFEKIPGTPVAYWVKTQTITAFSHPVLGTIGYPKQGFATGKNELFLRYWQEVEQDKVGYNYESSKEAVASRKKWFPCNKGGTFRRWYGNNFYLVNWYNDGSEMKNFSGSVIRNPQFYFQEGITWSSLTSGKLSLRYSPQGFLFESKGSVCFLKNKANIPFILGLLNSSVIQSILSILSPTLDYHEGPMSQVPVFLNMPNKKTVEKLSQCTIQLSRSDWDSYETSWDFRVNSLLDIASPSTLLAETYDKLRQQWAEAMTEMHRLEEENNRIFIDAYGLQEELTPDVPWNEITLTCNPWYRYGVTPPNPTCKEFPVDEALEARLKADTIKEFLSYAVGCMFGRYSLDQSGLMLANQGETLADYLKQIPRPTFMPDEDNVIPILDEDWFADDIVTRFNEFLKVTFGEENFYENLAFIEEALGKDVRSYFTKDFYKDHLQRYHKRPIYWLFSSPKGAFSALVYMHRYRPETVGLVLTYLRSHITKVTERIHTLETTIDSTDSTAGMKNKAIRERDKLQKSLRELEDYERDVLYPLATEKIAIDLDDGVKVNYREFGDALYKIKGLEAKEE